MTGVSALVWVCPFVSAPLGALPYFEADLPAARRRP